MAQPITPPPEAIDLLRARPETAAQFEQHFGVSAAPYLQQAEEDPGVLGTALDVAAAVPSGVVKAVDATLGLAQDVGGAVVEAGNKMQGYEPQTQGVEFGKIPEEALAKAREQWAPAEEATFEQVRRDLGYDHKAHLPNPFGDRKTMLGEIVEGITQFTGAYVALAPATGALKAAKGGQIIEPMVRGAAADFTAFDEQVGTLTDFLVQVAPEAASMIPEYLQTDEDDGTFEVRFKRALEGIPLGLAAEAVFKSVKGLRALRRGDKAEAAATAKDIAETAAEEAVDPPGTVFDLENVTHPDRDFVDLDINISPSLLDKNQKWVQQLESELALVAEGKMALSDVTRASPFNLSKIKTTDEVLASMEMLSQELGHYVDPALLQREALETVARDAEHLAQNPDELIAALSAGKADADKMAARVVAGRQVKGQMAKELMEYATAKNQGLPGYTLDGFSTMLKKYMVLEDGLKAHQTGGARTTSAGRIAVNPETMKQVDEVMEFIADGANAETVSRLLANADVNTFHKITRHLRKIPGYGKVEGAWNRAVYELNTLFINSILSGIKTHAVNITSNSVMTFWRPLEEAMGAAVVGNFKGAKDSAAQFVYAAQAVGDALQYMKKAWKAGDTILDNSNRTLEYREAAQLADPSTFQTAMQKIGGFIRRVETIPGRALVAEDEFFKQINYRANMRRIAHNRAAILAKGKSKAEYDEIVETYFNRGFDDAGRGLNKEAMEYARESTFTSDLRPGTLGHAVQRAVNEVPVLRQIVPFIRTPTNLIRQAWQRMPGVNLLQAEYRQALTSHNPRIRAQARGKMLTGIGLVGGAAMLTDAGKMTGGGPRDPAMREHWKKSGWEPYSIKIGGEWVQYGRLEPFSTVLGLLADINEVSGDLPPHLREEAHGSLILALGDAFGGSVEDYAKAGTATVNNLLNKTYLQGIAEFFEMVADDEPGKYERWMRKHVASVVVPNALKQANPDNVLRDARTMLQAIKAGIPGYSESVPPKYDFLGKPRTRSDTLFETNHWSPIQVVEYASDPLYRELSALAEVRERGFGPPRKTKDGLELTEYANADGETAYDAWMKELRDGRLEKLLRKEVERDSYKRSLPERKETRLQKIIEMERKRAWHKVLRDQDFRGPEGMSLMDSWRLEKKMAGGLIPRPE